MEQGQRDDRDPGDEDDGPDGRRERLLSESTHTAEACARKFSETSNYVIPSPMTGPFGRAAAKVEAKVLDDIRRHPNRSHR